MRNYAGRFRQYQRLTRELPERVVPRFELAENGCPPVVQLKAFMAVPLASAGDNVLLGPLVTSDPDATMYCAVAAIGDTTTPFGTVLNPEEGVGLAAPHISGFGDPDWTRAYHAIGYDGTGGALEDSGHTGFWGTVSLFRCTFPTFDGSDTPTFTWQSFTDVNGTFGPFFDSKGGEIQAVFFQIVPETTGGLGYQTAGAASGVAFGSDLGLSGCDWVVYAAMTVGDVPATFTANAGNISVPPFTPGGRLTLFIGYSDTLQANPGIWNLTGTVTSPDTDGVTDVIAVAGQVLFP